MSLLALTGCQAYSPQPLDRAEPRWTPVERLVVDPQSIRLPAAATATAHVFDPSQGLDAIDVETLAVVNNPDLKLARADLKIGRAQAFAAGLLPDPQVALSAEDAHPSQTGIVRAFNAGIAFDIGALVARSSKQAAANSDVEKTDMALLWQEWQVASQAHQLFVKQRSLMQLRDAMQQMFTLQVRRVDAARQALDQGNLTADALGPYLLSREDWRKQLADTDRQLNQTQHDLAALLGLAPDIVLDLKGPADAPPIDQAEVARRLARLADYRPDLVALEAGYAGQEQKFRAAILAQFPAITIGPTRLRDNTGVYSTGFAASLNLPIFSANRGNIAIERATRERLRQEYDNRLRAAYADVDRLLSDERLLEAQWKTSIATLPELERTADEARAALAAHQITIVSYVDLESAVAARRIEILGLQQSAWMQRVALTALLGDEIPGHRALTDSSS
ncbi:MAG TPA: TolC family protein [Variovorax sp.]